jgi:EAL domain-containing protein (putative c-di-GMP-specific phosphodiesterase class I)
LKQALRNDDTLARFGSDEFVALLLDLTDLSDCVPVFNRLLATAAQPFEIGGETLQISASLGIALFPQDEDTDAEQLLRRSEQAMYLAKLAGRNRCHVFDNELDGSQRGHFQSVQRINRALDNREFVLHYQPKVNMRTGDVIGAETLIRWQHPQRGLLAPSRFLPVIENHALAIAVGEWVLDSALKQMALWQCDGMDVSISVNLGARQLQRSDFALRLQRILAAHPQVNPSCLELEVLQSTLPQEMAAVSQVMCACRELGVTFSLTDFGVGDVSLAYLRCLPVSLLKVDQRFVRDMLYSPDDMAMLESVIGLANASGCQVLAQGVESADHSAKLLQLGCDLAQGFGIARPMPANEFARWAACWRTRPTLGNLQAFGHDVLIEQMGGLTQDDVAPLNVPLRNEPGQLFNSPNGLLV